MENSPTITNDAPSAPNDWNAQYTTHANDQDGAVTFTISFSDSAGNAGTDVTAVSPGNTTVSFDNTAPTFSSVAATDGTYKVSDEIDITVTWNETVFVTNTPTLTLSNGATATYNSGSGLGAALVFRYTVAEGETDSADLSVSSYTGTIRDGAGNTAGAVSGDLGSVIVDANAPEAAITYDSVGPYKNGETVVITATFDEDIADSPVMQIAIAGSGIANVTATNMTKSSDTVYTYNYSVPTGDGTGTISLSTGTDIAGNVITSTPTSGKTFTVDNTGPTYSYSDSTTTSGLFGIGDVINVQLIFNETLVVNTGSGTPTLTLETDQATPDTTVVDYVNLTTTTNTNDTLNFTYTVAVGDNTGTTTYNTLDYNWSSSSGYTPLTLNGGTIKDLAGNDATLTLPEPIGSGGNSLVNGSSLVIDGIRPTATISYSSTGPYKSGESVLISATFNETIADSPIVQIAIAGSGIAGLTATNMAKTLSTLYTYNYLVPTGDGTGTITLSTGTDLAGNEITAAPSNNIFTVDNTIPTISIVSNNSNDSVTVTFSENVYPDANQGTGNLTAADFNIQINDPDSNVSFSSIGTIIKTSQSVWIVSFSYTGTATGNETLTVNAASGSIFDAAGNAAATTQSGTNNQVTLVAD